MVLVKALIITQGSRGDVQPFLALTRELLRRGHDVDIAGPPWIAPFAQEYGAYWIDLGDIERELLHDRYVSEAFETNFHGLRGKIILPQVIKKHRSLIGSVLHKMTMCVHRQADILIFHATLPAHEIAEKMGIPAIPVCVEPFYVATSSFSNPLVSWKIPKALSRQSFVLTQLWVKAIIGETSAWRRNSLNLPPRRGHRNSLLRPDGHPSTVLQPISKYVLPPSTIYESQVYSTGFWFLPTINNWRPPQSLDRFIADGAPPVYIGFGSLVGRRPGEKSEIVTRAVRQAGLRAVVSTGSGGLSAGAHDASIYWVDDVSLDWLFQRVSAIVHHGGTGTVGLALASGRPQVVCPSIYGQPFNAKRMHELGVAPEPLPQREISTENLAAAMHSAVTEQNFRKNSGSLAKRIRSEQGVANAADIIESFV